MQLDLNLNEHKLTCLTGKNGIGKTTLIKAVQNLKFADTFAQTSPSSIFRDTSSISYHVDSVEYRFDFDTNLRSLNPRILIPEKIKANIDVELPMPHGQRFNFFENIIKSDGEIRRSIVLGQHQEPTELIELLNHIYSTDKFNNLVQITVGKSDYYCILLDNSKYIREDYLSSGEFFLISLYRKIKNKKKLIAIDEIDISLDAAAQTKLASKLREFCTKYGVNILFTTHSLPLMKTLKHGELFFMDNHDGNIAPRLASYNLIKSILYGFRDWDKYILTEDKVLKDFLEYLIDDFRQELFYRYKIIYIGTAQSVVNLLKRNVTEEFFSEKSNVIAILDGDQLIYSWAKKSEDTYFIPIESVEKAIHFHYASGPNELTKRINIVEAKKPKDLYSAIIQKGLMSQNELFHFIQTSHQNDLAALICILKDFLLKPEVAFRANH
jgi:ABC-type dipeptide/oligopeptide/nickel transport system ATPase subunit